MIVRRAARTVAALLLAACGASGERPAPVTIGEQAPAYATASLDGDTVSLGDHRGNVVLLNVWATWCHPCQDEIPVLQGLHERYDARGLDVIGVSVDARGEENAIRQFADRYGMTYPTWHDPAERVSTTFLIVGVPATFLIDRDGTLLWRKTGPVHENDPQLVPLIEQALAR